MTDQPFRRYGTDPDGRPIYMTPRMWRWWQGVVRALGFTPTIVQGAFMSHVPGGGAKASAGVHDLGGCIDVRTWDLTDAQRRRMVRTIRRRGGAAWLRNEAHGGMAPHCHVTAGWDRPRSVGARASWIAYLNGEDGLADHRRDYHWRPDPLVTSPVMPKPKVTEMDLVTAAAEATRKARHRVGTTDGHKGSVRWRRLRSALNTLLKIHPPKGHK